MAAARDQAARVIRQEPEQLPETTEGEAVRDPAQLADQLRRLLRCRMRSGLLARLLINPPGQRL